jgi:hypothetical protein
MDTFPELQGSFRELTPQEMKMVSGGLTAPTRPGQVLVKEFEAFLIRTIENALAPPKMLAN